MTLTRRSLRPVGDRIMRLEVRGPDGVWTQLERERRYLVATNSFIRGGGDEYTMLRDRGIDPYDAGPDVAELVASSAPAAKAQP